MILGLTPRAVQQTFCWHRWKNLDENSMLPSRRCIKCGRHETSSWNGTWNLTVPFESQPAERWPTADESKQGD